MAASVTAETSAAIAAAVRSGQSLAATARQFGVSTSAVRAHVAKHETPADTRDTLADALEQAIKAATHLTARDAAAMAAARALAAKIDAWDVIVRWAQQDAASGGRPAVPANDNTSLPTFLKYLEALQLVPPADKAKPGPASTASPSQQALNEMRQGLRLVPDGEVG